MTTPGRLVAGRYRLQSQLGGGGMGTVWLARDELLGRQVAIKQVLTPAGVSEADADQQRQRALREGRIAARLSHPHAISVYDVALESGQPWLVMEYLPSRSLAAVLAEDGALRADQVAQIGAQVADALAATHAAGIVHRDVKPANILIGEGGRVEGLVKITDFGISHARGDVTLTQTGQITGTPAFLSPEVAQGREMTEASDVFSLGATLYTCIEGTPPFGMEDNALAMLHRVAGGQIVPPRRAGSLTDPLLRMLAADPADRPTMPEVRDELARLAAGRDGDTTTVLLARTDLGSSSPAHTRTAAFPAGTPTAPRPAVAGPDLPAAGPAAATRDPVPGRPAREARRRRGRALGITAALVAVALAGLITFLVMRPADNPSAGAVTPSPNSSSAAAPTTEETEEPATTTPAETTPAEATPAVTTPPEQPAETPAAAQEALSADNIEKFLETYHELVLTDPAQAYALTGPTLRSAISESSYIDYWGRFEDVRLSDIRAVDGQNTATATMELRSAGGRTESSRRVFTFLVRDGQLILDSDYPAR
jgi:tRNA A-37 threonylcarbamoyl transferase component Bud32